MQLLKTLLFLCFSAATVCNAASTKLAPRGLIPPVDVCANIDFNLLTALNLPDLTGLGRLRACICASTVRPFVQANVKTRLAVTLVGEQAVVNAILNIVTKDGKTCTYPEHSMPMCLVGTPCSFGCIDGYTRVGKNCVCQSPKIVCNGICQSQACSSGVPQNPSKRGIDPLHARTRMRILTEERCPMGHRLCGVGGNKGADNWECIDTRRTLDSCGGCTYPYALEEHPISGMDCTAIPGVSGVQCISGSCVVSRCKRGWTVSPSQTECMRNATHLL